jgi:hypothetical protein
VRVWFFRFSLFFYQTVRRHSTSTMRAMDRQQKPVGAEAPWLTAQNAVSVQGTVSRLASRPGRSTHLARRSSPNSNIGYWCSTSWHADTLIRPTGTRHVIKAAITAGSGRRAKCLCIATPKFAYKVRVRLPLNVQHRLLTASP